MYVCMYVVHLNRSFIFPHPHSCASKVAHVSSNFPSPSSCAFVTVVGGPGSGSLLAPGGLLLRTRPVGPRGGPLAGPLGLVRKGAFAEGWTAAESWR